MTPLVFIKSQRFETPDWKKTVFTTVSVCLLSLSSSVTAITFERIMRLNCALADFFRAEKERTSSLTSHFWPTVMVLSIKNGFYKIKKSIFRPNYARYEKMLRSKIVHLKEVYNFDFDHFFIKRTVFVLIVKKFIKNKKFNFPDKLLDIRNKC